MNKKRFYDEFTENYDGDGLKDLQSEDFKQMFAGNIDDCFRMGISVMRKSMRLYAKFYYADIIIASPLGLRTIIGNQGLVLIFKIFMCCNTSPALYAVPKHYCEEKIVQMI